MKRTALLSILIAVVPLAALLLSLPVVAHQVQAPADFAYDPRVATMLAQVQTNTVLAYESRLTGDTAAVIGGVPYTLTTRNTNSGRPIQQANSFTNISSSRVSPSVTTPGRGAASPIATLSPS
jgi:hypothetical protein